MTVCEKSALASLKHVTLASTGIRANASKHKVMNYARIPETCARLEKEILERFLSNERPDEEQDRELGFDKRLDRFPEDLAIRSKKRADMAVPCPA